MKELLALEMKRAVEIIERDGFTPELKKLLATIRQHSIIYTKENAPAKAE